MAQIRIASREDIPELVMLINGAYLGTEGWTNSLEFLVGLRSNPELVQSKMNEKNAAFIVYVEDPVQGGRILGCVQVQTKVKNGQLIGKLELLAVFPKTQGQGIGKKLISAAETWAEEKGCVCLNLSIVHIRDSLIRWYERLGFVYTGEDEHFKLDPNIGVLRDDLKYPVYERPIRRKTD